MENIIISDYIGLIDTKIIKCDIHEMTNMKLKIGI
jgi:hypothetical protein